MAPEIGLHKNHQHQHDGEHDHKEVEHCAQHLGPDIPPAAPLGQHQFLDDHEGQKREKKSVQQHAHEMRIVILAVHEEHKAERKETVREQIEVIGYGAQHRAFRRRQPADQKQDIGNEPDGNADGIGPRNPHVMPLRFSRAEDQQTGAQRNHRRQHKIGALHPGKCGKNVEHPQSHR